MTSKAESATASKTCRSTNASLRGGARYGTGSKPPALPHGWQLAKRRKLNQPPRQTPWRRMASSANREHEGSKRQFSPSIGDTTHRYARSAATNGKASKCPAANVQHTTSEREWLTQL